MTDLDIYIDAVLFGLSSEGLIEKAWIDFNAPKGKIIDIPPESFKGKSGVRDLDDEIFDLIQQAYKNVPIGGGKYGNAKVTKPGDLPAGYTVLKAADIDSDPGPDYFRGGKVKNGKVKLGIVGHDGTRKAIDIYLDETAKDLNNGAIAEMSGAIAHIMITRYHVPAVQTQREVEKLLGKKVKWAGSVEDKKKYGDNYDCWYYRNIGGKEHLKILLGS